MNKRWVEWTVVKCVCLIKNSRDGIVCQNKRNGLGGCVELQDRVLFADSGRMGYKLGTCRFSVVKAERVPVHDVIRRVEPAKKERFLSITRRSEMSKCETIGRRTKRANSINTHFKEQRRLLQ